MSLAPKSKYLGESPVEQRHSEFKGWRPADFALDFIRRYGGIYGERHKTWVLDQVARILNGAPVIIRLARWDDGSSEYRLTVGTSKAYEECVREACDGEDGPETYGWDVGIAP